MEIEGIGHVVSFLGCVLLEGLYAAQSMTCQTKVELTALVMAGLYVHCHFKLCELLRLLSISVK